MLHSCALFAAVLAAAAPPAQAPERLAVGQAVQQALEVSPQVAAARERALAAEDQVKSHRGRMLPGIHLSDEQQHWDSSFNLAFPGPPGTPPTSVTARAVNTNAFAAAADQPVLGLLRLSQEQSALSRAAEAARLDVKTAESALREEIESQYLRLFEARALIGIAQASQAQLAEQIQVAKEKLAAGVLTNADVLRLQVAVANARQQEIQAAASEQIARAALLTHLGRSPQDMGVDFVEPYAPEAADQAGADLGALVERALDKRTEVQGAVKQEEAARAQSRARWFELLPEVDLEAGYTHFVGQVFVPKDQAYVGVRAAWQVWDWGARYYQGRAAEAQAAAARSQADDVRRRVRLDVASRVANVQATASALDTGRTAIASAEEAYRVTTALLAAGSASTTDLLDAQAALTQARLNFARARYAYAMAQVALARAAGEL